jgi:hypothetical protein
VQGIGDRALAQVDPSKLAAASPGERARIDRLKQVHAELGELIIARLGKLPAMARLPLESGHTLLVVHGSPADPSEPLTFDMSDDEILALLGDEPADIVVCGGSHVPFEREVADVRIINVGSVGEAPCSMRSDVRGDVDRVRVGARPSGELVRSGAVSAYGAGHADATFVELRAGELWVEQVVVPLGRAA